MVSFSSQIAQHRQLNPKPVTRDCNLSSLSTMIERRETFDHAVTSSKLEQLAMSALPAALAVSGTAIDTEIRPVIRAQTSTTTSKQRTGRWTPDEKILFLYGLKRFGKGRWKKMSVYLPHRSLVQIKSHAQKVLKRLEAGENVFRRLEENLNLIDTLILQASKQRDSMGESPLPKSTVAKREKSITRDPTEAVATQAYDPIYPAVSNELHNPPIDSDVAALAASALCQLSSLSA